MPPDKKHCQQSGSLQIQTDPALIRQAGQARECGTSLLGIGPEISRPIFKRIVN
jgi:hypothetical protein